MVEAEYRTQTVVHNSLETHQSVCRWEGDTLEVYISTQYIWGVRDSIARQLGLPPDRVRVVCNFMGGGFGSKNSPGDYTYIAIALASRPARPVRCALTRREENIAAGNRNATIQRLRAGARSDGTLVALEGEFVNAIGWNGFSGPTFGPMEMLYACENVRTLDVRREAEPAAERGLPRARLRRRDLRPRVRCSTSSRPGSSSTRSSCGAATTPTTTWPTDGRSPRRTCSSAIAAPSRTGRGATRCGRARRARSGAASASRARSGTAAAARPRTRGCASAPTAA